MAIQCNLTLTENRLFSALNQGDFSALIECNAPNVSQPFNLAVAVGIAMAREINKYPEILGLTVTCDKDSHDLLNTASVLRQALNEDLPMSLVISGHGQTRQHLLSTLSQAESKGIQNITFVTGDLIEDSEETFQMNQDSYLDSVQMLDYAEPFKSRLRFGATINPFKYTAEDMYLQYYKMMRKLFTGASFLITQSGFDMAKLQELQWYLRFRDVQAPVIARLNILALEEAQNLHHGLHAGVPISRRFTAMIQRELKNPQTFMERQIKRLELQIAGCKLLGYSGVQISGIKEVPLLAKVAEAIKNARYDYPDYASWLQAWQEFNADGQPSKATSSFYGYKDLLSPEKCYYDDQVEATNFVFKKTKGHLMRVKLLNYLLNPSRPLFCQTMARQIWLGNSDMSYAALRRIFFTNPQECPKHLSCGACGGANFDGTCEKGDRICMFHKVLSIANDYNRLNALEARINPNE